jgi:hypothetical protein
MNLLRMFVAGAPARATAEIVGIHRNTATSFCMRLIVPKLTNEKHENQKPPDNSSPTCRRLF